MPRNVRNFWIEIEIDGRKSRFAGGPVSKDGGFDLTIKQRHRGEVVEVLDVLGRAHDSGALTLQVRPAVDILYAANIDEGVHASSGDIVIGSQR